MKEQRHKAKRFIIGIILMTIAVSSFGCAKQSKNSEILPTQKDNQNKQTIDYSKDIIDMDEPIISENSIGLKDGFSDNSLLPMITSDVAFSMNQINSKSTIRGDQNNVLLAKDHTNNIIYYINSGNDFFIYRVKDGVHQLVLDIPARSLYLQNGLIYFMVHSYDSYSFSDIREGNILSFDPISGKVSIVVDEQVDGMIVQSDGIDWYTVEIIDYGNNQYSSMRHKFFYSFQTKNNVPNDVTPSYVIRNKEYHLGIKWEKDSNNGPDIVHGCYWTTADGKEIFISDKIYNEDLALTSDYLYGFLNSAFATFNMNTHELQYIDLADLETKAIQLIKKNMPLTSPDLYSYSLLQDTLYFSTLNLIYFMEDGNLQAYLLGPVDDKDLAIHDLFTDGENLYALLGPYGTVVNRMSLYQIEFESEAIGGLKSNKIVATPFKP